MHLFPLLVNYHTTSMLADDEVLVRICYQLSNPTSRVTGRRSKNGTSLLVLCHYEGLCIRSCLPMEMNHHFLVAVLSLRDGAERLIMILYVSRTLRWKKLS